MSRYSHLSDAEREQIGLAKASSYHQQRQYHSGFSLCCVSVDGAAKRAKKGQERL